MNGKGDKLRPAKVSRSAYEDSYDLIFSKKEVVEVKREDLYEGSKFSDWMAQCPADYSEDYVDNHGTRASYTFWID